MVVNATIALMKVSRENLRILLVDDDENDAELLRIDLDQAGFKQPITHFRNGSIALEYFKYTKATGSSAPHLILLDLNMPLIDGIRALRRLREVSSFRNLPVIILTGAEDKAKRIEVAKLGVFRFLAKKLHNANVITAWTTSSVFTIVKMIHPSPFATFLLRFAKIRDWGLAERPGFIFSSCRVVANNFATDPVRIEPT